MVIFNNFFLIHCKKVIILQRYSCNIRLLIITEGKYQKISLLLTQESMGLVIKISGSIRRRSLLHSVLLAHYLLIFSKYDSSFSLNNIFLLINPDFSSIWPLILDYICHLKMKLIIFCCSLAMLILLWFERSLTLFPQALLGGDFHMDLAEFQHTLWDILTKGDSVKVRYIILHFHHLLLSLLPPPFL